MVSSKKRLLIIIFLALILLTGLFMCIPSKDWRSNLVAEGVGAIITTGAISLIFYSWTMKKWKSIHKKIEHGIDMRVSLMVSSLYSLLENQRRAGCLITPLTKKSFDETKEWIKNNYEVKIQAFSFPDMLNDINKFFENYAKIWGGFLMEYKDYLDPEILNVVIELKEFLFESQFTLEEDRKFYDLGGESGETKEEEDYSNSLKGTLKEYVATLIEYVDKLHSLTQKGIILRDSI